MHHQRHRNKGQQFVKEIHGKQIRRKGNTQCNAVGHGIEHKEHLFMLFLRHIFKGVQRGQRPQGGNQTSEYHAHPVNVKADGQISRKIGQRKYIFRAVNQKGPHQYAV